MSFGIYSFYHWLQPRFREERTRFFLEKFKPLPSTRILDIGGNGSAVGRFSKLFTISAETPATRSFVLREKLRFCRSSPPSWPSKHAIQNHFKTRVHLVQAIAKQFGNPLHDVQALSKQFKSRRNDVQRPSEHFGNGWKLMHTPSKQFQNPLHVMQGVFEQFKNPSHEVQASGDDSKTRSHLVQTSSKLFDDGLHVVQTVPKMFYAGMYEQIFCKFPAGTARTP